MPKQTKQPFSLNDNMDERTHRCFGRSCENQTVVDYQDQKIEGATRHPVLNFDVANGSCEASHAKAQRALAEATHMLQASQDGGTFFTEV